MKHVTISGNAKQAGYEQGKSLRALVQRAVRSAEHCAYARARPEVLEWARWFERRLRSVFPELVEEMRGIAEGSECAYEDILVYNLYCELRPFRTEPAAGHCSIVGVVAEGGNVLVGKLHDDRPDFYCFQSRVMPGRRRVFQATYAGTVWCLGGMNESGLCCMEASAQDGGRRNESTGWPGLMLLRRLLERCDRVAEALRFLEGHDLVSWGRNILLADARGELVVVEKMPGLQRVREPEDRVIAATNFRVDSDIADAACSLTIDQYDRARGSLRNAMDRYMYLVDAAKRLAPSATTQAMQELICHCTGPGAVCREQTVYGAVLEPSTRTFLATHGPPCRNAFVRYSPCP